MAELESMLKTHERLADEPLRVRLIGFGDYHQEVEIYACAMTAARPEFLEIREDLLLKVMEIVECSGTRLVLPTGVRYVSGQEPSGSMRPYFAILKYPVEMAAANPLGVSPFDRPLPDSVQCRRRSA